MFSIPTVVLQRWLSFGLQFDSPKCSQSVTLAPAEEKQIIVITTFRREWSEQSIIL